MSRPIRDMRSLAEVYDHVASLASQVESDELAIKDSLVHALEQGRSEFALQILREWRTKPPTDILAKYLETNDGNSN